MNSSHNKPTIVSQPTPNIAPQPIHAILAYVYDAPARQPILDIRVLSMHDKFKGGLDLLGSKGIVIPVTNTRITIGPELTLHPDITIDGYPTHIVLPRSESGRHVRVLFSSIMLRDQYLKGLSLALDALNKIAIESPMYRSVDRVALGHSTVPKDNNDICYKVTIRLSK